MMTKEGTSQDFELNLAPIIDCFTVLIAFVMISTVFASIGILDAGVAAGGEEAKAADPAPVHLTVELRRNHSIGLRISGKEKSELTIPALGSEDRDHAALTHKLVELKKRWPGLSGATLLADNTVGWQDVVGSMEVMRREVPNVLLGGF